MRPVPAGRQRGQCCTPYSRLQEEIDNVETIAVTANNTANNAMTAATIQAGNAAQSAQDAQNSADAAAASAAAVAGALDDKVDKLTTANLKAYTHNGSTQGEKAVVDGTTADSIPIRDANGYVQGATNTTGTRDNVLTNGTRVQNDLDAYPSMVRTSGNQNIGGVKTITTVNGFKMKSVNGYNALDIASRGQSQQIRSYHYASDDITNEQTFFIGSSYSTSSMQSFRITAYAPRTTLGDTSEVQRFCNIAVTIDNSGNASVKLVANKSDGTEVSKTLGTFNGTTWN